MIEDATESTKRAWSYCPKCREKVQADFPDHGARLKALEMWFEQGYGRPGTSAANSAPELLGGEMTRERLDSMSTSELCAYVWLTQSEVERAADLRLVESLKGEVFPAGFVEALQRLDELACERREAVLP